MLDRGGSLGYGHHYRRPKQCAGDQMTIDLVLDVDGWKYPCNAKNAHTESSEPIHTIDRGTPRQRVGASAGKTF